MCCEFFICFFLQRRNFFYFCVRVFIFLGKLKRGLSNFDKCSFFTFHSYLYSIYNYWLIRNLILRSVNMGVFRDPVNILWIATKYSQASSYQAHQGSYNKTWPFSDSDRYIPSRFTQKVTWLNSEQYPCLIWFP